MNIIIFGGAFDPIHNGHINMAVNAQKALDGEVFLVPAPISIWKETSAPIEDKINMIALAIKDLKGIHIDRFEADSGHSDNYSIDTVKYFHKKYPNDNLYYLIGTDQVNNFHRWKDASEIAKIAHVIYFERPDFILDKKNIESYHMQSIPGETMVVSSTEIKQLKSLDIPDDVLFYIGEHQLYYVERMKSYIDEKRLKHSLSVAKLAYEIALSNHLEDPHKYYVAGLLHDIGKSKDVEKEKQIVEKHFPEYKNMPAFSFHQFVGAYIAEHDFGIDDQAVLNAIKFHATGTDEMDLLAKIIYASDKIEPTRNFDSSDLIAAMKKDAEEGFIEVLKANKDFLKTHRGNIDNPLTSKCFNKFKV